MNFKQSDKNKYLRINLDLNLNFKPHFKKLKQKPPPLISTFEWKVWECNLALVCYTGLIRLNLEYCALLFLHIWLHQDWHFENWSRCSLNINFNRSKADIRQIDKIYPVTKCYLSTSPKEVHWCYHPSLHAFFFQQVNGKFGPDYWPIIVEINWEIKNWHKAGKKLASKTILG